MAQKLYTEEQVRKAMQESRYAFGTEKGYDEILNSLTPIELPSDEKAVSGQELLSEAETLWLNRLKKYLSDYKYDYVCSWWLRLEYRYEDITTANINYILSKLVAKGILKKETTHSYTKFSLND